MRAALITGLAGPELSEDEREFLSEARPAGLILFTRNCRDHDQMRRLVSEAKVAIGSDEVLVLIDQEGGRVQRLRPPLGRALPPGAAYARLFAQDAGEACHVTKLVARLVADDLRALGINTNCTPVLDVPVKGAHDVIGDRALGREPAAIAALGRAIAEGHVEGGVVPVMKHIPGHGRATADSHLSLPVVTTARATLSATDFVPFRLLAGLPAAMTAHVTFTDIDPAAPASISQIVTREVIRGEIGFGGLLLSDDLSMKALTAPIRDSAAAVIRSGSDLALHCNGEVAEMKAAAEGVPLLAGRALERFQRALAVTEMARPFDVGEAERALAGVLARHRAAESV
jgi:beta-N-acetylhexosaminidase